MSQPDSSGERGLVHSGFVLTRDTCVYLYVDEEGGFQNGARTGEMGGVRWRLLKLTPPRHSTAKPSLWVPGWTGTSFAARRADGQRAVKLECDTRVVCECVCVCVRVAWGVKEKDRTLGIIMALSKHRRPRGAIRSSG